jgi:glycosyltransferase involved in cell wall biosynthesis
MTLESTSIEEESAAVATAEQNAVTTSGWPHVLLFTDSDAFAGTERHILDLAEGLRQHDVGVGIACPVPSPVAERAAARQIPVTPIAKRGMVDREAIATLKGLLTSERVQIIHAHNGRTGTLAAVATWRAGIGRCVATQHFIDPSRTGRRGIKARISRRIHRWVTRHTNWFIAVSRAAERAMAVRGDAKPGRVSVISNGICDFDRAAIRPADEVRRELGIAVDAPLIVCAARLQPEKDVTTLIESMAIVRQHHPSALCVVAGDGAQRQMLEDKIKELGLGASIRLLGFYADAASLIAAGDVFVLPSLNEPFGLVLLEAMALRRPVVSTSSGGPLEIVEPEQTGLLVTPQRPHQLGMAIVRIIGDRAFAEQAGLAGRRRFETNFTADVMGAATAAVYRRIIDEDL